MVLLHAVLAYSGPALAYSGPAPTPNKSAVKYYGESHGYVNALDGGRIEHRGEYFELVSPLTLSYAQVSNRFLPTQKLPPEIVRRFANRTMAITGFENQVTRMDGDREVAVPCSDLYNHHWNLFFASSKAPFSEAERRLQWGHPGHGAAAPPRAPPGAAVPLRQVLSEGNGNEHRGSFHGTPRGYAQLIDSPATADFVHMSINTRNPAGHNLDPAAAPQPRSSTSLLPGAGSGWSGVLECPCTTRRVIDLENNTIDGEPFTSRCVVGGPLDRTNNTICTLAGYAANGGMQCCKDGMVLLDADQPDHPPTTYYHKRRVYFEDGPPPPRQAPAATAPPQNAFRLYWQTEEWMGEYNVPQCATGTPPAACVHTLTTTLHAYELFGGLTRPTYDRRLNCSIVTDVWCGNVQAVEAAGGKFKLLNMAFHQHSPAVLSGELYNDETGELICRNAPIRGATVGAPLDEKGYGVGIPPCVWGSAAEGLPPPPLLDLRTRLLVIAKYNSSVPHYGVMAMWQGRGGL